MTNTVKLMREYRENHTYCPECGSCKNHQTLMGYVMDINHPEDFKDLNRVSCIECDWTGTVHDLVGE